MKNYQKYIGESITKIMDIFNLHFSQQIHPQILYIQIALSESH